MQFLQFKYFLLKCDFSQVFKENAFSHNFGRFMKWYMPQSSAEILKTKTTHVYVSYCTVHKYETVWKENAFFHCRHSKCPQVAYALEILNKKIYFLRTSYMLSDFYGWKWKIYTIFQQIKCSIFDVALNKTKSLFKIYSTFECVNSENPFPPLRQPLSTGKYTFPLELIGNFFAALALQIYILNRFFLVFISLIGMVIPWAILVCK